MSLIDRLPWTSTRNHPACVAAQAERDASAAAAGRVVLSPVPARRLTPKTSWALLLGDLIAMLIPVAMWKGERVPLCALALMSLVMFRVADLYQPRLQAVLLDQVPKLMGRMLTAVGLVALVTVDARHGGVIDEFLLGAMMSLVLLLVERFLVFSVVRWARRSGRNRQRVLIVGSGQLADRIVTTLANSPDYGLDAVAYTSDERLSPDPLPFLGPPDDLHARIDEAGAQVAIILEDGISIGELRNALRTQALEGHAVFAVPRLYQGVRQRTGVDMIGPIPVARLHLSPSVPGPMRIKRIFDVTMSLAALIILSPVLAVAALAVRIDGGPGILFRQVRVGQSGEEFEIIKFRTMTPATETEGQTQWTIKDDDRVTKVGRFLRRTSIDELPQLWSILKGDMTIVGPRPERPYFVEQFTRSEPNYVFRHRMPSGLTGLAQVNGLRGDTSIADRADYDNFYIENWSFWLDMKIIFRTFSEVLWGRGE